MTSTTISIPRCDVTKKPPKKPTTPKEPPQTPPLTDEEVDLLDNAHAAMSDAIDLMTALMEKSGRLPSRAFSVALTNLETAEMWMARGFDDAGLVQEDDDEEDDDEEGDSDGDEPSENDQDAKS